MKNDNEIKLRKTAKITLLIIIIILLCPFHFSYSKTDDTLQYSSILFSYVRVMLGSNEPHPIHESSYSVVNYSIETKVRILFFTVYDHSIEYEGWVSSD